MQWTTETITASKAWDTTIKGLAGSYGYPEIGTQVHTSSWQPTPAIVPSVGQALTEME